MNQAINQKQNLTKISLLLLLLLLLLLTGVVLPDNLKNPYVECYRHDLDWTGKNRLDEVFHFQHSISH